MSQMPSHIAVIMDGNGRWARQRGLPRVEGHRHGVKAAKRLIEQAVSMNLPFLTLYGFSEENWSRPPVEIETLFYLLDNYLVEESRNLANAGVRLRFLGETTGLPKSLVAMMGEAQRVTRFGRRLTLQIAFNYGARTELVKACRHLASRVESGFMTSKEIDADAIDRSLFSNGVPDPDLLIRSGGEFRISNFLLWQLAYTELYFTPTLWPDFSEGDLVKAIADYSRRERRFGGDGEAERVGKDEREAREAAQRVGSVAKRA